MAHRLRSFPQMVSSPHCHSQHSAHKPARIFFFPQTSRLNFKDGPKTYSQWILQGRKLIVSLSIWDDIISWYCLESKMDSIVSYITAANGEDEVYLSNHSLPVIVNGHIFQCKIINSVSAGVFYAQNTAILWLQHCLIGSCAFPAQI